MYFSSSNVHCFFTGRIPNEFCYLPLDVLEFQDNDGLICFPSCLTNITYISSGSTSVGGMCGPSSQDIGLCAFVNQTSIESTANYEEWSCSSGYPRSNPCLWDGIKCDDNSSVVADISLISLGVTGKRCVGFSFRESPVYYFA